MNALTKLKYVAFYSLALMVVALAVGCETSQAVSATGSTAQVQPVAVYQAPPDSHHGWDDETNLRISMTVD